MSKEFPCGLKKNCSESGMPNSAPDLDKTLECGEEEGDFASTLNGTMSENVLDKDEFDCGEMISDVDDDWKIANVDGDNGISTDGSAGNDVKIMYISYMCLNYEILFD